MNNCSWCGVNGPWMPDGMDRTNDKLLTAFAEVLREVRQTAGLSQEDLAERSDLSTRFVSFLENRHRKPTLTVVMALSEGLGLTLQDFAGRVEARYRDADLR